MKKTTLAIMLIAVLAIAGCTQAEQQEAADILLEDEVVEETTEEQMEEEVEVEVEADAEETASNEEESEVAYAAAEYTNDRAALDQAGPKVVYFHATWCPTCRALEERIQNTLSEFPDGTSFVQVDFDEETELKKQYGVKSQTSLVVLDAEGNQVGDVLVNPSNAQIIEAVNQTL